MKAILLGGFFLMLLGDLLAQPTEVVIQDTKQLKATTN